MLLERIYDTDLAQASYFIGCQAKGTAIVVDARRDLDPYFALAKQHGMEITAVTETHIHADFLSGAKELAEATGATLFLSAEGPADWQYGFGDRAALVRTGDKITAGSVELTVRHTPGHTPEHISFVLRDLGRSEKPVAVFTGDFVFVGDVGRPDLLEQAAGVKGTQEPGARSLFQSLQWIKSLPDHVLVWPAHGAGSPCGRALGAVPVSTVGYEKSANWALLMEDESAFVAEVLRGQPEPPAYYAEMKARNKRGPARTADRPAMVRSGDAARYASADTLVVDVRPSPEYLESHIYRSVHAPLDKLFTINCGWFVPYDTDIHLVASDEGSARLAAQEMALVGLDRVVAWAGPEIVGAVRAAGGEVRTIPSMAAADLPEGLVALDVRGASEHESDPSTSPHTIPYGFLPRRIADLDPRVAYAVHCQGGSRSPVAVSVLERLGVERLVEVKDGWAGMKALRG